MNWKGSTLRRVSIIEGWLYTVWAASDIEVWWSQLKWSWLVRGWSSVGQDGQWPEFSTCKKSISIVCGEENPASSISWATEKTVLMERQTTTATRDNAIIFLNFWFKSVSAHFLKKSDIRLLEYFLSKCVSRFNSQCLQFSLGLQVQERVSKGTAYHPFCPAWHFNNYYFLRNKPFGHHSFDSTAGRTASDRGWRDARHSHMPVSLLRLGFLHAEMVEPLALRLQVIGDVPEVFSARQLPDHHGQRLTPAVIWAKFLPSMMALGKSIEWHISVKMQSVVLALCRYGLWPGSPWFAWSFRKIILPPKSARSSFYWSFMRQQW